MNRIDNIKGKIARNVEKVQIAYQRRPYLYNLLIVILTFGLMFILYYTQPFEADDFLLRNIWNTDEPLTSFQDVVNSQITMYTGWSGRVLVFGIEQMLFLLGRFYMALFNTLAFMLLAFFIMLLSGGESVFHYMESIGILFFLNPDFHETICWFTGNAAYMWPMLFVLWAIVPFILDIKFQNKILFHLFFLCSVLIAFLGGGSNEAIAPSMVLLMMACLIYKRKTNTSIYVYNYAALLAAIAGCCFLVFAPGNYTRGDIIESETTGGLLMAIAYRGHGQINAWCNWLFPILLLLLLSYGIIHIRHVKVDNRSYITTGWGIVSVLMMLASPSFPRRTSFCAFVVFAIAVVININSIMGTLTEYKRIRKLTDVLMWGGYLGSVVSIVILQIVRGAGVYIPG